MDGVAIVDHNEVKGNIEAHGYCGEDFIVVPGIEFSTTQGHIICLGSVEFPERYLGITWKTKLFPPPEEVMDVIKDSGGVAIAAHPYDRIRQALGDKIYELPFDAIEVINGHTLINSKDPSKAADELGLLKVGGSDAHSLHEIGNICVECKGDDVVEAIRKGDIVIRPKNRLQLLTGFVKSGILKKYFGLSKE